MRNESSPPRLILPEGIQPPVHAEDGPADFAKGPEVLWDKTAPTAAPQPMVRTVPEWFKPVIAFLEGVVADEGLVLDLCLDKAVKIAEFNHNKGMVGIDFFPEATGGRAAGRTEMLMLATPLAVELYKQVCGSLSGERKAELEKTVKDALAARDAAGGAGT